MKGSRIATLICTLSMLFSFTVLATLAQAEEAAETPEKSWHIIPGLKLGYYSSKIKYKDATGADSFDTDASGFAVVPSLDFWYKKIGIGLSVLSGPSLEGNLNDPVLQSWGLNPEIEASRTDVDLLFKLRFTKNWQAFVGYRHEDNDVTLKEQSLNFSEDVSYTIDIFPAIGAAFSYPFDFGLTPYVVCALFPYAQYDDELYSQTGWGGGGEIGVAYSFRFPLTLSLGIKAQYLSFDSDDPNTEPDNTENISFLHGGIFYTF